MKSKAKPSKSLQKLSFSVGDFIRYWGFRRVHGAIWTQMYLSKTPLSCTDLTKNLGLSKALISPAIEELCHFKLLKEAPSPNEKTKVYIANENISDVIQQILKTREQKMIQKINHSFTEFKEKNEAQENLNPERVQKLESMILSANFILDLMIAQKDLLDLPFGLGDNE